MSLLSDIHTYTADRTSVEDISEESESAKRSCAKHCIQIAVVSLFQLQYYALCSRYLAAAEPCVLVVE